MESNAGRFENQKRTAMKYSEHANVIGQVQSRCEAETLKGEDLTTWQVNVTRLRE